MRKKLAVLFLCLFTLNLHASSVRSKLEGFKVRISSQIQTNTEGAVGNSFGAATLLAVPIIGWTILGFYSHILSNIDASVNANKKLKVVYRSIKKALFVLNDLSNYKAGLKKSLHRRSLKFLVLCQGSSLTQEKLIEKIIYYDVKGMDNLFESINPFNMYLDYRGLIASRVVKLLEKEERQLYVSKDN